MSRTAGCGFMVCVGILHKCLAILYMLTQQPQNLPSSAITHHSATRAYSFWIGWVIHKIFPKANNLPINFAKLILLRVATTGTAIDEVLVWVRLRVALLLRRPLFILFLRFQYFSYHGAHLVSNFLQSATICVCGDLFALPGIQKKLQVREGTCSV